MGDAVSPKAKVEIRLVRKSVVGNMAGERSTLCRLCMIVLASMSSLVWKARGVGGIEKRK